MGNFTPAKTQGDFAFIPIRQKAADVAQFDVVVAIVRTRTELDFLDLDDRLLRLGFCSAFLLLVLELSVVHQAANRGVGRCSNFHQIHIQLASHAKGFHQTHNAQRLVVRPRETNFWGHDFTVQAVLALFALATITKFSSDGYLP